MAGGQDVVVFLRWLGRTPHPRPEGVRFFHALGGNSFAGLPNLRVLKFGSSQCEDLRPLARCVQLRELELTTGISWWRNRSQWPGVSGLEKLVQLEKLSLAGNLLAFPRGIAWPNVRVATLKCEPLAVRCLRDLPQLSACEFLTLGGVERLDGIEAFP